MEGIVCCLSALAVTPDWLITGAPLSGTHANAKNLLDA